MRKSTTLLADEGLNALRTAEDWSDQTALDKAVEAKRD